MDITKKQREIPSHIRLHFQAHAASGKTVKEYSIEAGISPQTFYTWRKKYRKSRKHSTGHSSPRSNDLCFSTVGTISLQELRQPLFDIHFAAGHKVTIHRGTTVQEFAPYLELLSGGHASC